MKVYKLTLKNHFRHLWVIVMFSMLMPIIAYYLSINRYGEYSIDKAFLPGIAFILVFILPILLLHLNHFIKSSNVVFSYDGLQDMFTYRKNMEAIKFGIKDIESITCVKSRPQAENRTPVLPWDLYSYATIRLNNGRELKISSLLVYEFDKEIPFEEIDINKTFYSWIH